MATVQLPGSKRFDTQISVHTVTKNTDVSLAQEFQKRWPNKSRKRVIIDHGKHKKGKVNKSVKTGSVVCNIIKVPRIRT